MDIVVIDCPDRRKVLVVGRVLVYSEDPANLACCNATYDAESVAEALARAAGVGGHVERVQLPAGFAVWDEDGPNPRITPESVRDWWVSLCDAEAEDAAMAAPPTTYPTLVEQFLGAIGHAGLEINDEVRRLAAELERVALDGGGDDE